MRNRNYNEELDEDLDEELDDEYDEYDDEDDDDEDDSIAKKLKKLKGKIEGVALFFLIIGGIGLISIICSFFVGGGFGFGGKPVPEDIYGTYYAVSDYQYYTIYIDEEGSSSIVNRGFGDGEETVYIKTEYVEVDPFDSEPKPEVEVQKPEIKKTQAMPPMEPKTINPQRDRYKSIDLQIVKPAYVRHGASFLDENENVPTTIFQPVTQRVQEESEPATAGGSLF